MWLSKSKEAHQALHLFLRNLTRRIKCSNFVSSFLFVLFCCCFLKLGKDLVTCLECFTKLPGPCILVGFTSQPLSRLLLSFQNMQESCYFLSLIPISLISMDGLIEVLLNGGDVINAPADEIITEGWSIDIALKQNKNIYSGFVSCKQLLGLLFLVVLY